MGWQVESTQAFAGGEREETHRSKRIDARGGGPAGEQSFGDRGVASNQKVPEDNRAPSRLFSSVPRRVLNDGFGRW